MSDHSSSHAAPLSKLEKAPSINGGMGWALGAIVLFFAVVRLAGMFGDLWLDEIWSLRMVQSIQSPLEVFTKLQHDNNHPLNSLFLYLVQPGAGWTYRVLSWFAGSASVWLAALLARDHYRHWHPEDSPTRANGCGILTAVLVGGAYLLIHYSSEARGYASAVACALLATYALSRGSAVSGLRWAALYFGACVIGLMAHLAMVQVMLAAGCWVVIMLFTNLSVWREHLRRVLIFLLPSWLFFGAYYFGFVRNIEIGGGPENGLSQVRAELAVTLLGTPALSGMIVLSILLGAIVAGLVLVWHRSRGWAIFYVAAIFATPAIGILFSRFTLLFPRYFIISAAFALIVIGYGLTRLWWHSRIGRGLCLAALLLFLIGNALQVERLWAAGRGHYQEALSTIIKRTPFEAVTISSDHDFRNYALVDYYQTLAEAPRKIVYYQRDKLPPWGTQWRILHRFDDDSDPPKHVTDDRGNFYVKERVYPYAGLSGWSWIVYRNMQLAAQD